MDDRKLQFLTAILGESGASALRKASERSEALGNALLPRAIYSWLVMASRFDYEGGIPGVNDTYINFHKSEDGFNGSISIGDDVYKFQNASVFHLGASVAVALGVNLEPVSDQLRDTDIVKLGKSIDVLVKAKLLTEELLKKAETMYCTACKEPLDENGHCKVKSHWKDLDKQELPGQAAAPNTAEAPAAPTPTAPKAGKPRLPKPAKLQGLKGAPTIKVTKSEFDSRCKVCGMKLFKGESFNGCFCFRAIASGVRVLAKGEDYTLEFDSRWDEEAVQTLVESLGR